MDPPAVGAWEAIIEPKRMLPFGMSPSGIRLDPVRVNLKVKADKTFTMDLPMVSATGTWLEKDGVLTFKLGSDTGLGTSKEIHLRMSDDKRQLSLQEDWGPLTRLVVFTRADGK